METKTNFFTLLAGILAKGVTLTLTFKADGDNQVVSVKPMLTAKAEEFEKLNTIRPIVLTHPPEKLDEGFFTTILVQPVDHLVEAAQKIETWKTDVNKAVEEVKTDAEKKPKKKSAPAAKKKAPAKPAKKAKPVAKKPAKPAKPVKEKPVKEPKEPVDKALITATKYATAGKNAFEAGQLKFAKSQYDMAYKTKALDQWKIESDRLQGLIEQEETKKRNDELMVKNLKRTEELDKQYEEAYNKGDYSTAMALAEKANGLIETKTRKDRIADCKSVLDQVMKAQISPLLATAEAAIKGMEFQTFSKNWKEIRKLSPDHPKLEEMKQAVIEKIGEATVKQLLNLA